MNKSMSRMITQYGEVGEHCTVNVFDIETKKIVFTGSGTAAARWLGIEHAHLRAAMRIKSRTKSKVDGKKYAIRKASTK